MGKQKEDDGQTQAKQGRGFTQTFFIYTYLKLDSINIHFKSIHHVSNCLVNSVDGGCSSHTYTFIADNSSDTNHISIERVT